MNHLKVVGWVATFVLTLATSGWASQSPEPVLTAYMDALIADDIEAAYSLLSNEDRAAMSWSEWASTIGVMRGVPGSRGGEYYQSFSISRIELAGDTAEGVLQVEVFDMEAYRVNFAAFEEAVTDADREAVLATLDPMPTVSTTETIHLRREASGWRVHLSLEAIALERDRNDARDLEVLRAGLAALGDSTPGQN